MEGFISGRRSSLVVLVLCLGTCDLLTVVASSELPFLQPLQHGAISESTQKQGTQHLHWLRMFFRDHMAWSPSGSHNIHHHHHRIVHKYQPRQYITAKHAVNCEMLRRTRSEHGVVTGHRFHLRGTPSNDVPVNGIVYFHFRGIPETSKPTPGGHPPPPQPPKANVIVEVVGPSAPENDIVDRPAPSGFPPPPTNPGAYVNPDAEVVSPPIAVERANWQ